MDTDWHLESLSTQLNEKLLKVWPKEDFLNPVLGMSLMLPQLIYFLFLKVVYNNTIISGHP